MHFPICLCLSPSLWDFVCSPQQNSYVIVIFKVSFITKTALTGAQCQLNPAAFYFALNSYVYSCTEGEFSIPFHFSIPPNALESYNGRDVRIVYEAAIIQLYGVEFPKWGRGRQTSKIIKKEISLVGYEPNNITISEMEILPDAKGSYSVMAIAKTSLACKYVYTV
jgi:hypothetical protein